MTSVLAQSATASRLSRRPCAGFSTLIADQCWWCRGRALSFGHVQDLGRVRRIDQADGVLIAEFDSREVEYPLGELDALVPAYATTIHKSQGSEYPAIVIAIATQHYAMLARNLLYTAVTRGKRLVVIVGQRKALAIAVRTHGRKRRWTKLKEWLSPR